MVARDAKPRIVRLAAAALSRARSLSDAWKFTVAVWALSRAFFLTVGALGVAFIEPRFPGVVPEPPGILNYWAHWDGAWYSHIATNGYTGPAATAFFPVYPLLIHFGTRLGGGPAVWGVVISSAALLFALYFVYRIAEEQWGPPVARASALAFAFFPTAFFLNAVYAEAVFVCLSAGALWALYVRRDLMLAGWFAFPAAATRNVGILLAIPLAYGWFRSRREFGWSGLIGVVAAPVGFVCYLVYVGRVAGHPLTFAFEQEQTWGRTLTSPLTTLARSWSAAGDGLTYLIHPASAFGGFGVNPSFALSNTLNFVLFVLVVVALAAAAARLPLGLFAYCLAAIAAPVLTPASFLPFTALSRYVLAAFPLFYVVGLALARRRTLLVTWLAASAALGVFLTLLFASWRWVG